MASGSPTSGVRLTELLAAVSLGTDLGMGQPMEHVLRQCLLSLRLAERMGLADHDREVVYYVALLAWVGCHVDAYEQAKWFGDDIVLKTDFRTTDFAGSTAGPAFMLHHLGAGRPLPDRIRLGMSFLGDGMRAADQMLKNHATAADELAARLGLGTEVRTGVEQTFERWDGRGAPRGCRGEEIALTSRLVNLADVVVAFHRAGGVPAAVDVARQRSGTQFDPAVVEVFCGDAEGLLADLEHLTTWDAVMAAEPTLAEPLSAAELDSALEAIADFTDLKSPYTIGHSRGVAALAEPAARDLGLDQPTVTLVRRAALVHDLGRLGVSNTIWDKTTPLSQAELERVRWHPYLTERMLVLSPGLAPLGALAVQHHERLDGSGYPRGLRAESLSRPARILAAADAYRTKIEPRPYRDAGSDPQAAAELRDQVRAGRLDGEAVDAVLRAAGHEGGHRHEHPAGLTSREIEVLGLLARGLSNRQIADQLVISRKTAGSHIEHIYTKLGVSNRALACLFAAQHGLIGSGG